VLYNKALHFCYGIGAFVSPMIAEPFLLNEDCSPFIDNDTIATLTAAADLRLLAPPGTIPINDTNLPADTLMEAQQMTRVRFAFWIMAAVQVLYLNQSYRLFTRGDRRRNCSDRRADLLGCLACSVYTRRLSRRPVAATIAPCIHYVTIIIAAWINRVLARIAHITSVGRTP